MRNGKTINARLLERGIKNVDRDEGIHDLLDQMDVVVKFVSDLHTFTYSEGMCECDTKTVKDAEICDIARWLHEMRNTK